MSSNAFVGAALVVGLVASGCRQDVAAPDSSGDKPAFSATVFINENVTTPLEQLVLVPCPNGGSGELVLLSGEIHDVLHVVFDGRGGVHVQGHDNWQGVSGVGQITGAKYQGTRTDLTIFNGRVGEVSTQKSNVRVVGQGSGNNFVVHSDLSIRVNANGTVTVSRDEYSTECG